jgi:hypothetical protein
MGLIGSIWRIVRSGAALAACLAGGGRVVWQATSGTDRAYRLTSVAANAAAAVASLP